MQQKATERDSCKRARPETGIGRSSDTQVVTSKQLHNSHATTGQAVVVVRKDRQMHSDDSVVVKLLYTHRHITITGRALTATEACG